MQAWFFLGWSGRFVFETSFTEQPPQTLHLCLKTSNPVFAQGDEEVHRGDRWFMT